MHATSLTLVTGFVSRYMDANVRHRILDVGSADVNGTYKYLFTTKRWIYHGIDLEPYRNVDVITEPFSWPIKSASMSIVVCGQSLEHSRAPWKMAEEIARVTRPGGLCCIVAPWHWPIHFHPDDCWRYLPDGMRGLFCDTGWFREAECGIISNDCFFIGVRRSE